MTEYWHCPRRNGQEFVTAADGGHRYRKSRKTYASEVLVSSAPSATCAYRRNARYSAKTARLLLMGCPGANQTRS